MNNILYVDAISKDGSIGITKTKLSIAYNQMILGHPKSAIFSAGKFICMNLLQEDESMIMAFIDHRANPENAQLFLRDNAPSEELKQKYISIVELVNSEYEERKNQYILEIGESPIRNINPEY